ncbi:MAG: ATP-dependent DNA helicase RecG [Pseudomonadota bacterium]
MIPIYQIPISNLKGVGPKSAERLHHLGLHRLWDCLFYLPYTYQDRRSIRPIDTLENEEEVLIEGELGAIRSIRKKTEIHIADLHDATGSIALQFFNFKPTNLFKLPQGTRIQCFGRIKKMQSKYFMAHPKTCVVEEDKSLVTKEWAPIYPSTAGLDARRLQQWIQDAVQQSLNASKLEWLPTEILHEYQLPTLDEALLAIHLKPDPLILKNKNHPCLTRIKLEELLAHLISWRSQTEALQQPRRHAIKNNTAKALADFSTQYPLVAQTLKTLPFELTSGQQRALVDIFMDFSESRVMNRLIQGDVGSGKTWVAVLAAIAIASQGDQVAFMVPTEILARQHAQNIRQILGQLNIQVEVLVGALSKNERRPIEQRIANGQCQLVIGTHALFQEAIEFSQLKLVIVDEQHRFGVAQRTALVAKGPGHVHRLMMTATPIPRTLAQTLYADLDTSIIDTMPLGRVPIQTLALPSDRRDELAHRLKNLCAQNQQVYWVCSLIEQSDSMQQQAVDQIGEWLNENVHEFRIGIIHGRLKSEEKQNIMQDFAAEEISILVATSVIEVGVHAPKATLMVIENAERWGLAQLHQIRGRIGRSNLASYCVLLYETPLSPLAEYRIRLLRSCHDGFKLAEQDLLLRGPGELSGQRQSGFNVFKCVELQNDYHLIHDAQCILDSLDQLLAKAVFDTTTKPIGTRWFHNSVSQAV